MPVLDTSFLIDVQKGHPSAQVALAALQATGAPLLVPYQAALEFMSGFAQPLMALEFLHLAYRVVEPSERLLVQGAQLRQEARRKGRRPAWGDLWIAAQAVLDGTFVVSANPDDFVGLVPVWDHRDSQPMPA